MSDLGKTALPHPLVTATPSRLGGEAVFAGTRVPVQAMFDYLQAGDPLDRFLDHFPDVSRTHALAVLEPTGLTAQCNQVSRMLRRQ